MSAFVAKILLLPGFDGTGELFKDFVASLPPGFEASIARYPTEEVHSYKDLTELVERLVPPTERFVIVAESFSVPIAIQFAARNLPNLKGLILCAGFARSPVHGRFRTLLRRTRPILFKVAPPGLMIRILLVGCGARGSLVSRVQSAVRSVSPQVLAGRLKSVLDCDVCGDLERIKTPILYLRAKHDRVVGASCGEEILRLNPLCRLAELNGPHLLLQRYPVESANAVIAFLRGLEP